MSFYPELDELTLQQLTARFEAEAPEGEGALYHDELGRAIAAQGAVGVAYLWERRTLVDAERVRAIIAGLSASGEASRPQLLAWLHEQLGANDPRVVAEAIDGLKNLGDAELAGPILALTAHTSEQVRGAVLRFARVVTPDRALSPLVAALKDPHPIVREGAADELGELGDRRARSALALARDDVREQVRQAIESALELLDD